MPVRTYKKRNVTMRKKAIRRSWKEFTEEKDFMLNPDKMHVDALINGLLESERKLGIKLCPCRSRDGTLERDLELICPCNFKMHDTWEKEGRCKCGLFVKR